MSIIQSWPIAVGTGCRARFGQIRQPCRLSVVAGTRSLCPGRRRLSAAAADRAAPSPPRPAPKRSATSGDPHPRRRAPRVRHRIYSLVPHPAQVLRGFTRQIGIPAAGGCPDRAFQKPFSLSCQQLAARRVRWSKVGFDRRFAGFERRFRGFHRRFPGFLRRQLSQETQHFGADVAEFATSRMLMSRNPRQSPAGCRGRRDNPGATVAQYATTRAPGGRIGALRPCRQRCRAGCHKHS